jgi:hypothetical protein
MWAVETGAGCLANESCVDGLFQHYRGLLTDFQAFLSSHGARSAYSPSALPSRRLQLVNTLLDRDAFVKSLSEMVATRRDRREPPVEDASEVAHDRSRRCTNCVCTTGCDVCNSCCDTSCDEGCLNKV